MEFLPTKFSDAWLIKPKVFGDKRGFFMESYSQKEFQDQGLNINFVQDNHSRSADKGVLRGLHFQKPPHAQSKLVRVAKGSVLDVIVDLRQDSETYGQWDSFELSDENFLMLFVPKGFAHGMCTLERNTDFLYKVDEFYDRDSEGGIAWNDSTLNIKWPVKEPVLSEKDEQLSDFSSFATPF